MTWITSAGPGIVLTVLALALSFASAAVIECSWGSHRVRRRVFASTACVVVAWLVVVGLRFTSIG